MIQFRCSNCKTKQTIGSKQSSIPKETLAIKHFNPKESIIIFSDSHSTPDKPILKKEFSPYDILNCKKHIEKNTFICRECCYKTQCAIKQEIIDLRFCMSKYLESRDKLITNSPLKSKLEDFPEVSNEMKSLVDNLKNINIDKTLKTKEIQELKDLYKKKLQTYWENFNNSQFTLHNIIEDNSHKNQIINNCHDHIEYLKLSIPIYSTFRFQDFVEEKTDDYEFIKDKYIILVNNTCNIYYNILDWDNVNFVLGELAFMVNLILVKGKNRESNYKIITMGDKSYIANKIYNVTYPLYYSNNRASFATLITSAIVNPFTDSIDPFSLGMKNLHQCVNDIYKSNINYQPIYRMQDDKIGEREFCISYNNDYNTWLFALKLLAKNIVNLME